MQAIQSKNNINIWTWFNSNCASVIEPLVQHQQFFCCVSMLLLYSYYNFVKSLFICSILANERIWDRPEIAAALTWTRAKKKPNKQKKVETEKWNKVLNSYEHFIL